MGLDDDAYSNIRSQILTLDLLPSLDRIYSMVQQEDNHKKVMVGRDRKHDRAMAFAVNVKGRTYGGDKGSCTHGGKIGHEEASCFELVGYPSGWNSRGGRNGHGRGRNG